MDAGPALSADPGGPAAGVRPADRDRNRRARGSLFDAWKAEQGNADKVAAWFGTDREGIDQAVYYTLDIGGRGRSAAAT